MNTPPTATLSIRTTPGGIRCEWTPEGSGPCAAVRSVAPGDAAAVADKDTAPSSQALAASGRLIFSRLLPREVRNAVFSAPTSLVTLHTDLPCVPWETATDGVRTLGELHAVARGGGKAPPPPGVLRLLLVTDPRGNLPHNATEARTITRRLANAAVVHPVTLAGAAATRHGVLEMLETRPFDVVHFSCHGTYDAEEPMRSALECYDEPLTAADLAECSALAPPALCVLNACESGRRGRAVGLPGALRSAGVAAVVAALWPVDNRAATFLSTCLFGGLASGKPVAEALRLARIETRRLFAADPLQTWAAFILDGAPDVTLIAVERPAPAGMAPLIGRDRQWAMLDDALEETRAGRRVVVLMTGPSGSGRSRLLEEWCSAQSLAVRGFQDAAPFDILVADDTDLMNDAALAGLQAALTRHRGLAVLVTSGPSRLVLPPDTRVVPLPPLEPPEAHELLRSLGRTDVGAVPPMYPAELVALGLGLSMPDAGRLANALPDDERSALRAVALLDGEGAEAEIAQVALRRPATLARALNGLCDAGWLLGSEGGVYRLRVPDNAGAIIEAFRPVYERRTWARRAASRLKETGRYEAAGRTLAAAGDAAAAAKVLREGFRAAFRLGDHAAALRMYRHAETAANRPPAVRHRVLAAMAAAATGNWEEVWRIGSPLEGSRHRLVPELAPAMAEACLRRGDTDGAERWESRIVGESERAAAHSSLLLARGDAAGACRSARPHAADSPRAAVAAVKALLELNLYDEAVRVASVAPETEGPEAVLLQVLTARALQMSGRYADAEARYLAIARNLDDELQWDVAEPYASLLRDTGRLSEAEELLDRAMDTAGRRDDVWEQSSLAGLRASVYRRDGRYERSLAEAERAGDLARSAGLVILAAQADIHRATALLETGRIAEAERALRRALEEASRHGHPFTAAWATAMLGLARLEARQPDAAVPILREAIEMSAGHRGVIGEASSRLSLAWALWDLGKPDRQLFESARKQAAGIAYRAVECQASFAVALLDGDRAASEEALRNVEALNMGPLAASLRARRGEWHARRQEWGPAEQDLTASYRVARRLGMRPLQARAAEELAVVWERTQPERAAELRTEAATLRTSPEA